MRIVIETVPFSTIPNAQCGDWRRDADGTLQIKVSQEIGDKFALLVAFHEMIEQTLCEERGITCQQVDAFDKKFEEHRHPDNTDEPGNDPDAPYKREHFFAESLERLMAAEMNVAWDEYGRKINSL